MTRTGNFRAVEDWLINAIDARRSREKRSSLAKHPEKESYGYLCKARSWKLFEVVRIVSGKAGR